MQETPEQFATRIWVQMAAQWSTIQTFRQLGQWGLPQASSKAQRQNVDLVYKLAFDPANAKYLNQEAFLAFGLARFLPETMTKEAIETFEIALDAASLVFAHSVLDSAAQDYCRLCATLAPKDFLPFVGAKKLTLAEIEGQSFETLLLKLIEVHLTNLEKESLLKKLDFLFQICQPPSGFAPTEGYSYSRERLTSLDELRHKIVHAIGPTSRLPKGEQDLEFLWKTGYFMFDLVNERYGIKIDQQYVFSLLTEKAAKNSKS